MARIRYGSLVQDISGSIGASTFQKSLYGNTLRIRPRNNKTRSSAQQHSSIYLQQCQNAWRSLDPAVRRQWDQFISYSGQSINRDRGIMITGHALFIKWNFARLAAGLSIVSALVYKLAPSWPYVTSVEGSGTSVYVYVSREIEFEDINITFFISAARGSSLSFSKQGLRFLRLLPFEGDYAYSELGYPAIFGRNVGAGDIVHVKYQFWSTLSPILSALTTQIFTIP